MIHHRGGEAAPFPLKRKERDRANFNVDLSKKRELPTPPPGAIFSPIFLFFEGWQQKKGGGNFSKSMVYSSCPYFSCLPWKGRRESVTSTRDNPTISLQVPPHGWKRDRDIKLLTPRADVLVNLYLQSSRRRGEEKGPEGAWRSPPTSSRHREKKGRGEVIRLWFALLSNILSTREKKKKRKGGGYTSRTSSLIRRCLAPEGKERK